MRACLGELERQRSRGVLAQGERQQLEGIQAACERRLREIEKDQIVRAEVDAFRLLDVTGEQEYGSQLAGQALQSLEQEHGTLPDRFRESYRSSWFRFLCGAFQVELKDNQKVANIYLALAQNRLARKLDASEIHRLRQELLDAFGDRLSSVEETVRKESDRVVREIVEALDERIPQPLPLTVQPTYVLPALGRCIGRDQERHHQRFAARYGLTV